MSDYFDTTDMDDHIDHVIGKSARHAQPKPQPAPALLTEAELEHHYARLRAGSLWLETLVLRSHIAAQRNLIAELREALKLFGAERQFPGHLCWCVTAAGLYCVGQERCRKAQAVLQRSEVKG